MKTIGFMISKENEKRRALLPNQVALIKNRDYLYFQEGYGEVLGHCDEEYKKLEHILLLEMKFLIKTLYVIQKLGMQNIY